MSIVNITLATLAEIVGDFSYKEFARKGSKRAFAAGSFAYVGVIYWLIQSLKTGNILYVNGMWDGISGILESLAAFILLGERFNHPMQYVGLVLISLGIFSLKYFGISK
jgi:multidrug transporter EmrE-like cation transporter